ncbi:MAG: beta-galactosidase [Lachnospiraceae bacterium]|nr:beta-galactosidase [Lachnospiraceae bacterium]
MIPYNKLTKIPYGGDYNPEQWPEEIWEEDMRLFKLAGIDIVTLNVFSWAALQPDETTYDFSKLDKIMELVKKNGLKVCMATSTGAHPAWMARKYPDVLRTDFQARKRKFGGRHNSCPSSPTYEKYSVALAEKLAERYKEYDNIVAWHISNEYGGECYCENCEKQFRVWLQKRYKSIDKLNEAWNTAFWGHTLYDWDDAVLPDSRTEFFEDTFVMAQGIAVDYDRFMSDAIMQMYIREYDAIKKIIPDAVITTNLMGFYKRLNYFEWAKHMDFISWDNYPAVGDTYAKTAMAHDLMRGIKNGEPFALMEQTPSVTNWHTYCALKRPGVMRLWSYQAVAHGADTVMFFQMRRSIGSCEKYHGAVIDHAGHENTRVFREISALGKELEKIGPEIFGLKTKSDIALMMDWENWWAIEYSAGPSQELRYLKEFGRFYETLRNMNYNVDIVSPDMDLSSYKLVIAPLLYMVKYDDDENIRNYVKNGGNFVTTFFSGIVQENDLVITGGYPGRLRDILGIWVEEQDALPNGEKNQFIYHGKEYPAELLCDLLHLEGAKQIDEGGYQKDFYAGMPVLTKNNFGEGAAYYVATASNEAFYREFIGSLCGEMGIEPVLDVPEGIEVTSRENDKKQLIFIMNHNDAETVIHLPMSGKDLITGEEYADGEMVLEAKGVRVLKIEK